MAARSLRDSLSDVEAELAGLDDRRAALESELSGLGSRRSDLEKAAEDLRTAIASLDALGRVAGSSGRSSKGGARRASGSSRPKVTPEQLVETLQGLGGTASVDQLVEALDLPDGRSLNGARRTAVDAGTIVYADRTYRLAGS